MLRPGEPCPVCEDPVEREGASGRLYCRACEFETDEEFDREIDVPEKPRYWQSGGRLRELTGDSIPPCPDI